MRVFTVKDLKAFVDAEMKKGNGNKRVLLSGDDEGNSYHLLFYGFTPFTEDFRDLCGYGVSNTKDNDFVILG